MKNTLLPALILLGIINANAQFVVGTGGMTILSGTDVYVDGLTMNPSTDLTLTENELTISDTPLPGTPGSIARVYNFSAPISFEGTLGMFYDDSELNSNTESLLQLVYVDGTTPMITTGSSVDESESYISNSFATPVTIDDVTAANEGALPVKLADFTSRPEGKVIVLSWKTTSEANSEYFEVQRSTEAMEWQMLGRVKIDPATFKGSSYNFVDEKPFSGRNYYRLKIMDLDRRYAYSNIVTSFLDLGEMVSFYPNPVADKLEVSSDSPGQISGIKLLNQSGKILYQNSSVTESSEIDMSELPSGVYIMKVNTSNGQINTAKIVKK